MKRHGERPRSSSNGDAKVDGGAVLMKLLQKDRDSDEWNSDSHRDSQDPGVVTEKSESHRDFRQPNRFRNGTVANSESHRPNGMMSRTGRIKSFDPAKGYGYIHCYESSEDVFVHAKHINGYRPGNYVTFKEGRFKGRPEAQELDDWKENTTAAEEVDMATERHMEEVQRVGVYSIWEENPEVYCDIASRRRGDEQFEQWFRRTWGADEPLNLRRNDVEVAAAHGWDWRGDQSSEANELPSAPALRRLASDGSNDESRFSDQGHTGTIRSYNTQKGYGFIASDDSPSQDYFVHSTQINGFRVGDKVMFGLREWKGEIQAHQLRKIEYLPEDGYEGQESGSSSAFPDSSPNAAETYQGVIKCFLEDKKKEGKGYGFIASKMYGADVYVGEKEYKKGDFKKGDVVNFIVRVDKQGRPRASKLAASTPEVDDKIYFGTVRSFNNDSASGYGFITCTEVTEKYSRDAFLHHKQIKDFKLGDAVKFKVRLNNQGHPQAFNLEAALNSMSWLMEGLMEETKETKETKEDEAEEQAEMSHAGVIKSFDVSNGYGFITCTETSEDIFLHAKVMEGFAVGDHVCFKIRLHKGRKQAHSLEHDEAHDDTLGDGKEDDTAYIGTIKSFNTEKGYGFIQCEELHAKYGRDVFIPLSQYQGMSVGGKVTFKIQVKKNQPQAMDVCLVASTSAPTKTGSLQGLSGEELDTRLLMACESSRVTSFEDIDRLLEAGANPNCRDVTDQTALMICALQSRWSERKSRVLILKGADIGAPSRSRAGHTQTVLEWARERINPKFAQFLEAVSRGDAADVEIAHEAPSDDF